MIALHPPCYFKIRAEVRFVLSVTSNVVWAIDSAVRVEFIKLDALEAIRTKVSGIADLGECGSSLILNGTCR